jgi:predicted DNA binding protein
MTTVAEFTADPETFPFGRLFERFPEATVELERIVPSSEGLVPYLWLRNADGSVLAEDLGTFATLASVEPVDSVEHEHLFRIEWTDEYEGILSAVVETGVTLLSATGTADEWVLEVRGTRDEVAAFQSACEDRGVSVTLTSLYSLGPTAPTDEYGLTDPQREALLTAFRMGYFDHPRRAALADVAAELDISRQALSARLRRGSRNLVGSTIVPP